MKLKIAIVGADGTKFNKEQEEKVKQWIEDYLSGMLADSTHTFPFDLVLVSGHCPVGPEEWYCCDCHKWHDGTHNWNAYHLSAGHKVVKVHKDGGVDTWAEIIATKLGIEKEIYPAPAKQWNDKTCKRCKGTGWIEIVEYPASGAELQKKPCPNKDCFNGKILGYRSRNILIAEACDVLYDIEVAGDCRHCGGRGIRPRMVSEEEKERNDPDWRASGTSDWILEKCRWCKGTGVYSGGTWTMRKAKELGKEVHQIVIK